MLLDGLNKAIRKKFGKVDEDIIYDPTRPVKAVTSGSAIIDMVSGVGGILVEGRITEIIGLESSGKTTLMLQSAAQAQKAGKVGIYIDIEQTFDMFYAQALGLKTDGDTFAVYQPTNAEQVEMLVDMACKELGDKLDYIMWDSLAASLPKAMLEAREKEDESSQKGQQAAFMSRFMPKLNILARRHKFAVMISNQLRQKIEFNNPYQAKAVRSGGVAAGYSNDTSWYSMGGNSVKYFCSMRFLLQQMRRQKNIEDDGEVDEVGNWIRIENIKNKVAVPFKRAEFVIIFGEGVSDNLAILMTLENYNVLEAEGRTWVYHGKSEDTQVKMVNTSKDKFYKALLANKRVLEDAKVQYNDLLTKNNRVAAKNTEADELKLDPDELEDSSTSEALLEELD